MTKSALAVFERIHRLADLGDTIAIDDRLFLRELAAQYLALAEERDELVERIRDFIEAMGNDGAYREELLAIAAHKAKRALVSAGLGPEPSGQVDRNAVIRKLWLWKNGDHYWAFEHEYPCYEPGGDPLTLGKPAGWAYLKPSFDRALKSKPQEASASPQLSRKD